ncbi:hypothetical protein Sjap_023116 [Stephania japonica]|uniref:HMA domain-containing protein n=1 Tax=Stephania japonica TaxID=461633 RepID=A0AAP0HTV4_9MAGN
MEVVELKVRLHCKSCEKMVRKSINKVKGNRVEVELDHGAGVHGSKGCVEGKLQDWEEKLKLGPPSAAKPLSLLPR